MSDDVKGNVVQLRPAPRARAGIYHCGRCDAATFAISERGDIVCTSCSGRLHNLVAVEPPRSAA